MAYIARSVHPASGPIGKVSRCIARKYVSVGWPKAKKLNYFAPNHFLKRRLSRHLDLMINGAFFGCLGGILWRWVGFMDLVLADWALGPVRCFIGVDTTPELA